MTSCLSFHAAYRCQHAGACCAAPWHVKADDHVVAFVKRSPRYTGHLEELFVGQPPRPGQPAERAVAKRTGGLCVFREDRRCVIHAEGGEAALPVGCRHYPRVVRRDRHGIALSLSHYCPTAASLLIANPPVAVVAAPSPLTLAEPIEGLDARDALPPLLRPDLLMDVDAYAVWETCAVECFSRGRRADVALYRLANATDLLRGWTPGAEPLAGAVGRAFAGADDTAPQWIGRGLVVARDLNRGLVPLDGGIPEHGDRSTAAVERVIANYLAARVFGNWIAYQGRGLRTIVTWLAACHDVVRLLMSSDGRRGLTRAIEAIRQADYVMLHTIDTQAFATAVREVER